jgi:hypothetical protein
MPYDKDGNVYKTMVVHSTPRAAAAVHVARVSEPRTMSRREGNDVLARTMVSLIRHRKVRTAREALMRAITDEPAAALAAGYPQEP